MYFIWMAVIAVMLIVNAIIMNKYKEELTYQKWFEFYFYFHKVLTALPAIILEWASYIYMYDMFNSAQYYEDVFMKALVLLSVLFVLIFLLLYLSENSRKIYAVVRVGLLLINIYQVWFIYIHRNLLAAFDISRNVFQNGTVTGIIILAGLLILDLLNFVSFIYYFKYNKYEMTN